MSTTASTARDVRVFDVRRDARPAVAPLRALRRLHGAFADAVSDLWSETLRADVEAECVLVEVVTAGDLVRGLPAITVLADVVLDPLPGQVLVEFDASLGLVAVERLLGGSGRVRELRVPTLVESDLLSSLVDRTVARLGEVLSPLTPVRADLRDLSFDPSFVRLGAATDPVTLIALRVRIEADGHVLEGTMTLCYPERTAAPIVEAISADETAPATEVPAPAHGPLAAVVPDLRVPITVQLAPTEVTAGDIAALQVGDVLRLDHRVGSDVLGAADGALVLAGRLGRKGMRLAVELSLAPRHLVADLDAADPAPSVPVDPTRADPWADPHGTGGGAGLPHDLATDLTAQVPADPALIHDLAHHQPGTALDGGAPHVP